jgi:protein O-mannosyl-transferase
MSLSDINPKNDNSAWKIAALIAIVILTYLPSFGNQFIWDDNDYVTDNTTLKSIGGLRDIWFQPSSTPQYYPVVFTSFWIEYQLWGSNALGYHVVNVLIHALNAVLVFSLLSRLKIPGAWIAAAFFGIHPVHVESVAWITERKNLVSGAFYLFAALVYLPLIENHPKRLKHFHIRYWLSFFLFVAALLSKSVTASLPAAILLIQFWLQAKLTFRDLLRLTPFFVAGSVAGIHTAWLEITKVGANVPDLDWTFLERLQIAGRVPWFYLGKLLIPQPLCFIYPRWAVDVARPELWCGTVASVSLIIGLYGFRHRIGIGPLLATLYFGGTLFPVLGFARVYPMRFSIVADHFQYLASLGPIALFGAFVVFCLRRFPEKRMLLDFFVVPTLVLACVLLSWLQQFDYENESVLWANTYRKNPDCYLALVKLGTQVWSQGDLIQADDLLRRAVKLAPNYEIGWHNLGGLLREKGDINASIDAFQQAIRVTPDFYPSHLGLAQIMEDRGALDLALQYARSAVAVDLHSPDSYSNLGRILARMGKTAEAIATFHTALDRDRHHVETWLNLAGLLAMSGQYEQSVQTLKQILHFDANNELAIRSLSDVAFKYQDYRESLKWCRQLLALQPKDLSMLLRMVKILACAAESNLRDPKLALEISAQLDQKQWNRSAEIVEAHAEALAANREFESAITCMEEVLKLTENSSSAWNERRDKLERYRQRELVLLKSSL